MQIQTHSKVHRKVARPGPQLSEVARLDQQLAEGNGDSVDLNTTSAAEGKKKAFSDFKYQALQCCVFGGLLGLAGNNMGALGAALGAGTGLYIAWNKSLRKNSGKVSIELNGEKRTTRYYGKTTAYQKTPQEVRAEMLADGRLGEQIPAYSPRPSEIPKLKIPAELAAHKETLSELAEEKKLVADFGQKSRYGYETLNFVDATSAAKLIAAGKPVYAVAGESQDTKHSYKVVAANVRSTTRRQIHKAYVERDYNYELHPLTGPESFQELPEGEGLPEGFTGVYKEQGSCSQIMATDAQNGFGTVGKNSSRKTFDYSRMTRDGQLDLGSQDSARVIHTGSVNIRDLVMMTGIAGGMITGMSLFPGVPFAAAAGGAIGGVAGRELGWLAQDHMPSFKMRG